MGDSILSFLVSLILSLVAGIPVLRLAERFDLMDMPGAAAHKTHAHPTPLAGGILLVVVFGIIALLFRAWVQTEILVILAGAFVVFLFGLWDDKKGLSAIPKLIGQSLAAILLISFGVKVQFMTALAEAGYIPQMLADVLNFTVTMLWVVGITNAINLIDSMDGIVAGFGVIAAAFFVGATQVSSQGSISFWAAALLGTCGGLYFWNSIKAKFFLGDSGAQTIGFILASLGIMYNPLYRSPESSWIVPILILAYPIFDTSLVTLSRIRRRQAVGIGRRDHTYHRLIAIGMKPRLAVSSVHAASLIISGLAFSSLYMSPLVALIIFFAIILIGIILLIWLERKPSLDETNVE
ncbi:MAG TPA: MraY family glycosyltransferase [Anaerolineales bacterium]|nr:MraY family glycosyltransferase [Anaerolineales bacterium]